MILNVVGDGVADEDVELVVITVVVGQPVLEVVVGTELEGAVSPGPSVDVTVTTKRFRVVAPHNSSGTGNTILGKEPPAAIEGRHAPTSNKVWKSDIVQDKEHDRFTRARRPVEFWDRALMCDYAPRASLHVSVRGNLRHSSGDMWEARVGSRPDLHSGS
jgi:hypothetical protein